MSRKEYLGDSVYVEVERDMLKLTTNNGDGPNNTIFLEQAVWNSLVRYVKKLETAGLGIGEAPIGPPKVPTDSHIHTCDGCGKPGECCLENCNPDIGYLCWECEQEERNG